MHLFDVAKVPMFCDGIAHRLEKRKTGDEVKVVDLTLRIQPFTNELASTINQDEYGAVKRMLFNLITGEANDDLRSVEFVATSDRQRLICFATPDTEVPSIAFDQVKVKKIRARTQKDVAGWALYVYVSFGPLGKSELEYVNDWYTKQRFVSFEEAEPSLDFEDDDLTDADEKARHAAPPPPMWDDDEAAVEEPTDDSPATVDAKRSVGVNRPLHSHQGKKRGRRKATEAATVN